MNNTSLVFLENQKKKFLQTHELDSESLKKFQEKIKQVSEEESNILGKELFSLVSKKGYNDDYEKALKLIYDGANIEYKDEKKGDFVLLICARKNYFKTFISLLKAGANINQVNNYLTSTTMASARHGNKEMLEILIIMGADINARCLDGDNAIMSAKWHNRVECFNLLVNASAILTNKNLANKTMMDIPSTASFDFSNFPTTIQPEALSKETSFDDTQNLIEEALKRMKELK